MKKSVLLLLLISLALLASSCLGSPAAGISLATGETTNDSSEDDTLITFIKDGKTDYVIVAPLGCPSVISETANNMKGFCYNLHSVHFWVKYDKNYNETPYEILIGKTDRAESDTVISTLGKYEYAIRFVGNKLVIGGGSAVATEYAAKIFTEQYITADNPLFSVPRDINITGSMPAVSDKLSAGWNLQYFDAANGKTLPYSIYIPSGFDINKEYALFVYMHGLGNNGDDGVSQTKVVSSEILNQIIKSTYKNDVIIVSPQCPEGFKWVEVPVSKGSYAQPSRPSVYLAAAVELIDTLTDSLPVDANRIYGWGNSMGAFACYDMITRYPELFAAVVCVAGTGDPTKAYLAAGVPVWAFHSTDDALVQYIGSKEMIEALIAAGNKDVKLTTYTSTGHNTSTFVNAARTTGILDWIFTKTK